MASLKDLQLPSDIEPQRSFSALEPGRYEAIIIDSELKDTKAGTGQYLQLTFEITSETGLGRKLWARLNVANPNKTAENIAYAELAAICQATGVAWPLEDSDSLHDKPLMVDVVQERNTMNDSMGNRIKGYSAATDLFASPKPVAKQAAPARQPWAKAGR